jgi:hypothetical protein
LPHGRFLSQGSQVRHSHAFGIGVRSSFQAPGLPADVVPDSLPITQLDLVEEQEIDEEWRHRSPKRLLEETFSGTEPDRTIDFDKHLGYRLYARHFGTASISPAGEWVVCAPPGDPDWSWQRFLVGRVLPWAALLRGRELFHASAVQIGGRAIAFVAATERGKTSLALHLVLRGAGFITDDVLALEPSTEGINAHPGANIVAVRPTEQRRIASSDWGRLGTVLGTSGKTYVEVERETRPLRLDAIYFIRSRPGTRAAIEAGVGARELLGSTFIRNVTSPARLTRLLDLCGQISASASLFWLSLPPEIGAESTAEFVREHAVAGVGGAR